MTTDFDPVAAWVTRIRLAGDEIDAWAAGLHPSAWDEALADRRAAFAKLCANGPGLASGGRFRIQGEATAREEAASRPAPASPATTPKGDTDR